MDTENKVSCFEICKKVENEIKSNGRTAILKNFLISYLIQNKKLKTYIQIGVYKGNSLFSVSYSISQNGGLSYGIDSYQPEDTKENYDKNVCLNELDYEKIYRDVLLYREKCSYGDSIRLLKDTPVNALRYFNGKKIKPDIVYLDGTQNSKLFKSNYENYYKIMQENGFFVFDCMDCENIKAVYEKAKAECVCVFECDSFAILQKVKTTINSEVNVEKLSKKLYSIYERICEKEELLGITESTGAKKLPVVSVGILTYNHEKYIEQCLRSVVEQRGDFKLNVIILDDNSTDDNNIIIQNFLNSIKLSDNVTVNYIRNEKNLGVVESLCKLVNLIKSSGSDYFAFCEGDDYYFTKDRLALHLKTHLQNPYLSISFNKLLLYFNESDNFTTYDIKFNNSILSTEKLAQENYIGNLAATFCNSTVLKYVNDDLFEDMFTGDWMFHLYISQYGDIYYINFPLSVYRKHNEGVWSGKDELYKAKFLINEINKYNKYLNFAYNKHFDDYILDLENLLNSNNSSSDQSCVAVIDDIFPHPISGFRYEEFTSLLENIPDLTVYSTGASVGVLGSETFDDLIVDYKRNFPSLSNRVKKLNENIPIKAKLLYCDFLGNAYSYVLPIAEKNKIPFIFTLYPGGAFAINSAKSDEMLGNVFSSQYFHKVIVTQKITYDYLVNNKFCKAEDIRYIFGVVTPNDNLHINIEDKKHFGINKDVLDICFVAHKYTEFGEDKGYDIFINVAKRLSKIYDNIAFHVVGPWDKDVLNTDGIKNIAFYGTRKQEWFNEFYKDKDIILSPNTYGKIYKGSFDGFPTGCATDAALRKVAVFATDPLNLNDSHFVDGNDFVIIKHSVNDVLEKIKYYYNHPVELKSICENGCKKVRTLYNFENQMEPRIKVILDELELLPFEENDCIKNNSSLISENNSLIRKTYRRFCPFIVKRIIRKLHRMYLLFRRV